MVVIRWTVPALLALGGALGSFGQDDAKHSPVDFATQIRPLLSDRCFTCHGPDPSTLQASLRLDLRECAIEERDGYAAIVPGDASESELVFRITSEADPMPPVESKLVLDKHEVELLTRWIEEGAPYAPHWSFLRPEQSVPQPLDDEAWVRDPLDRFVLAKLESVGLAPAPEADRATLLRRVSFDLTGLPPTLEELDSFLADESQDAYERVVARLLDSTRHAERMTAEWLDVARYADTFGYQADVDMNVWPWRDWVLGAFESNLPYDRFLTQQLAGDLLPDATRATRLATAFNRLHRQTNEGGSVEEEYRLAYVSDRVETTSAAFMGLTVACARCHDHKFDPISQRDYYALSSYFDDIDESGLYSHFTRSVPTPALDLPSDEQAQRLTELEERIRAAEEDLARSDGTPGWGRKAQGSFAFEPPDVGANSIEGGAAAQLVDAPQSVEGARGRGLQLSGENAVTFPGIGDFRRADPFSIAVRLNLPTFDRAVVIHRTKSWTDAGSRGYQVLVEEGRLTVALVHFWPGDAIAIRTREPVPVNQWFHATFTYDGSSRANGLALYLDGMRQDTVVVRDHLTRSIRGGGIEHLTIGSRFRDKGYKAGKVDDLSVYARKLSPEDVAAVFETGLAPTGESNPVIDTKGEALRALRSERDVLRDSVKQIMTMAATPGLHTAHVLQRGLYSEPRESVEPATPAALPSLEIEHSDDRLDLARWLTHPDHPLTARVQVDRLWRTAFSQGLVPSPEDLGSQAPPPVHRALLDTLARDFVDSSWDSRALLERFVLSATYRQSSASTPRKLELDPDNVLLSRASRGRLPAEMIRDGALHAAGLLVEERGGPPVHPYQPLGLWEEKSGARYPTGRGNALRRRSLYTFWKRTSPPPTLSMFDAPAREVCTVSRPATTSPLQSLALWNGPQFVEAAVALGKTAFEETASDEERVVRLMRMLTSKPPTKVEKEALVNLLVLQRAAFRMAPKEAAELATYDLDVVAHPTDEASGESQSIDPPKLDDLIERAATAVVAGALLDLYSVVTRR